MAGYDRVDRQAEEIRRGLDNILRNQVKDPRIPAMFSITKVELARDLKHCKVSISAMTGSEQEKKELLKALRSASGFIRHQLGQEVILRAIPELAFELDDSIEYSVHINQLLRSISTEEKEEKE